MEFTRPMLSLPVIGFVLFAACSGQLTPLENKLNSHTGKQLILEYSLSQDSARYDRGESVPIKFSLENLSDRPLRILKWYTPMEGIAGDIFHVALDGHQVEYIGRMVRRGQPLESDYLLLGPYQTVTATVDLAEAYDLSRPGAYSVDFTGTIHDAVVATVDSPRKMEEHIGMTASGSGLTFLVDDQ